MPGLPVLQGLNPLHDVYSHALASVYHNQWPIIEPAFAQEKEDNVWELIQRDATTMQGLLQLRATVASKSWALEPATKSDPDVILADIVREAFEQVENFDQARAQMVDARFRARSYHYPKGRRRLHKFPGTKTAQDWWMPYELQHVDKLRLRRVPIMRGEKPGTVWELWSVARQQWEEVRGGIRKVFVSVVFDDEESRLGYGRGLLDTLHFLWWAGSRAMKELLQGVERYAQGTRIGKVDTQKRGGSGTDANSQLDDMLDMLTKSRSRHDMAIDSLDDIEIKDAPGNGLAAAQGVLELINRQKIAVIMGSVLPFGQSEGVGSLARSMTEETTADVRIAFDRCVIDQAITRDLVGAFVRHNQKALQSLGLANARVPHFRTTDMKIEDPRANAERAEIVLRSGAPIKREDFYAAVDFEQPKDGDDVITPPALPGGFGLSGQATGLSDSADAPGVTQSTPPAGAGAEVPGSAPSFRPEQIRDAVEVFKALGDGSLTPASAVRMFETFFGLPHDEAVALVGDSGKSPTPQPAQNERVPRENQAAPKPQPGTRDRELVG